MPACGGTWIAHGSGSADRDAVDRQDRIAVPPRHPAYALRRVWLSEEEENGYYYGFANEGCGRSAISRSRADFRTLDWEHIPAVNRKFADAVLRKRGRKIRSSWCRTITSRCCRG